MISQNLIKHIIKNTIKIKWLQKMPQYLLLKLLQIEAYKNCNLLNR
jgi:hypothetical protein